MELACDESTIRRLKPAQRTEYAKALLSMAAPNNIRYASGFAGSGIKMRINQVISYKKITVVSVIGFLALFLMGAVCLLSN